ncbi:polyprenyl synthetase family protein [Rothia uropygialis]|uniref:polyprenyl synthetase family protein n=1 Tax=Kocuria sp. 36 TaxID=1415402 RepID=UPI001EE7E508|nr:polyprenyl synthetase family protein [Kocuria sp. 36]
MNTPDPNSPTGSSPATDSAGVNRETAEREYIQAVDEAISDYLGRQRLVMLEISPEAVTLVDHIEALCSGGKRMRALLAYWGWQAAGGGPSAPEVVLAGAAIELFQSAALIHDDIIDHSDTRRGKPSVHRSFQAMHREEHWSLNGEEFGIMGGIVAGDLCLSFSEAVFASIGTPQAAAGRARRIFDIMRTEVMAGQYLDGLSEVMGTEDPEEAIHRASTVIRYKSAKYSCEHPLTLGAALAGAGEPLIGQLSEFGLPLGEAFQLRDDVLGVFGEPHVTGKPAGDDLREGKRTVLVALAERTASAEQVAFLEERLGRPDLDEETVNRMRDIIRESGALAEAERIIQTTQRQVQAALRKIDTSPGVAKALEDVASRALHRSS